MRLRVPLLTAPGIAFLAPLILFGAPAPSPGDRLYEIPALQPFAFDDDLDPPPPTAFPLSGRGGLQLLEAESMGRTEGFLDRRWPRDLAWRREAGLHSSLLDILREADDITRLPYRREETFLRGEAGLRAQRWDEAAVWLRRFVEEYPGDPLLVSGLLGLGEACYRMGQWEEAEEAFARARGLGAGPEETWMAGRSEAWIRRERGDTLGARATLELLLGEALDRERREAVLVDLAELELALAAPARARPLLGPWTEARGEEALVMDPRGFYLAGWAHFLEGDRAQASASFESLLRMIDAPPADWVSEAHAVLGWIHLERGDTEGARRHYGMSLNAVGEAGAQSTYGLAVARQREGDNEGARTLLRTWQGEIPPSMRWRWSFALGFLEFQLGHDAAVPDALSEALGPGHPDSLRMQAWLLLGDASRRLERIQPALEAYRRAAALTEDPPEELLWRWAVSALELDRWTDASQILGRLVSGYPGSSRLGEFAFWRGESLYRLGHAAEAERLYKLALKGGYPLGPVHYALGWCAYTSGRYEDAAAAFGTAIASGLPASQAADAALRRGHALSNLGRWRDADASYADAQALARESPIEDQASFRRAWLALRGGDPVKAADAWRDLAAVTPDPRLASLATYWSGQAAFASGDYERALHSFRDALARAHLPDSLRAASGLGEADALYNAERWDEALGVYRRIISDGAAPRSIRMASANGVYNTLVHRESWDEASRFLEETVQTFPDLSKEGEKHLRIADGYLTEGDFGKAETAYGGFLAREDLSDALRERGHVGSARALEGLGLHGEAAGQWEIAGRQAQEGRRRTYWLDAARLYLLADRHRDVVRLLEEMKRELAEGVDGWRVPFYLAQAYEALDRIEPSVEAWRDVAAAAASDTMKAQSWANAGRLSLRLENWEEGLDAFGRVDAMVHWRDVYRTAYWMGEALFKLGRWKEAEEAIASFLGDPPEEVVWEGMARLRRAACLEKMERWNEASREYDRVLALDLDPSLIEEARIRKREVQAWSDSTGIGANP